MTCPSFIPGTNRGSRPSDLYLHTTAGGVQRNVRWQMSACQ